MYLLIIILENKLYYTIKCPAFSFFRITCAQIGKIKAQHTHYDNSHMTKVP